MGRLFDDLPGSDKLAHGLGLQSVCHAGWSINVAELRRDCPHRAAARLASCFSAMDFAGKAKWFVERLESASENPDPTPPDVLPGNGRPLPLLGRSSPLWVGRTCRALPGAWNSAVPRPPSPH